MNHCDARASMEMEPDEAIRQVGEDVTGAQGVQPGYGFLSENTKFAAELEKAGAKFIGPNSKAILDMGDKIHSKKIATAARVSMIPGFDGEIDDEDMCVKVSRDIGYPVMIKASAGGGGKGMRVAWNDKQARERYRPSKQEAASSFGDDRMLVDKFIDNPRHIEMQVLCGKYGNVLWLNERECSARRRKHKIIEKAFSSIAPPEMRRKMGIQDVQLAKAVGYDNFEFLVHSRRNFLFPVINNHLQVKCIIGTDIVQKVLRVAYAHSLTIIQGQVPLNGWAFESRFFAGNLYKEFVLPSVGRLSKYVEPSHVDGIRCDSGVREGSEISNYYDPLICNVICGITHNIPLLRDCVLEKGFLFGDIITQYLPKVDMGCPKMKTNNNDNGSEPYFPLLQLADVPFVLVIRSMTLSSQMAMSLCSQQWKTIITNLTRCKIFEYSVYINSRITLFLSTDDGRERIHFNIHDIRMEKTEEGTKDTTLPNAMTIEIVHENVNEKDEDIKISYKWEAPRQRVLSIIKHFQDVFKMPVLNSLCFSDGCEQLDMNFIHQTLNGLNYESLKIRPNCPHSEALQALQCFLPAKILDLSIYIQSNYYRGLILSQNYETLRLSTGFTLNDLLITRSRTVVVYDASLSVENIRRFLQRWKQGFNRKLRHLEINFSIGLVLDWLLYVEGFQFSNTGKTFDEVDKDVVLHHGLSGKELKGSSIRAKNGKIGTCFTFVRQQHFYFHFYVQE